MAINYERIGFNIRRCRKRVGVTQKVLAEKVCCTPEHFSHIEKGDRRGQLEMLVSIYENLNVALEDILENALPVEIRQAKRKMRRFNSCCEACLKRRQRL